MASTTAFTYNELIAAIQTWLEDDSSELIAALPDIVAMGESRVYTDFNLEIFNRVRLDTLTVDVNEQPIKSATWQGTRSIHITPVGGGIRTYLERRTYEWCVDFEPLLTNTGAPVYFAELNETEYFMTPAPDVAYPVIVREISQPDALTVGNQTTWLSDQQGDILLDACMVEAEQYTKSDQYDVDKWKQFYMEKLPTRRMELRDMIRSDYSPIANAARTVDDRP